MNPRPLPPPLFLRFFRWYCHPKLADHIEGDLLEEYVQRFNRKGKRVADFNFILDVLLLFRPGIIRPMEGVQQLNTYGMYRSYLKVGWRNLLRSKGYSFINITGLAIGMTVAILNGLWIWDEFSFNKQFVNHDRIAMVSETGLKEDGSGDEISRTTMTYPLATELREKYNHHFSRIARVSNSVTRVLSTEEVLISGRGFYADPSVVDLFSFAIMDGNRKGLETPSSILLSTSTALALFGTSDPIGRTIRLNNKSDVIVTGVFPDFPKNNEFAGVKFVAPWSLYLAENKWIEERALNDWRNHFIKIYVEIPEGPTFAEVAEQTKGALHFDPADDYSVKSKMRLSLYPMSEWHLHPPWLPSGSLEPVLMVKLVGAIGAFVLALACINFINLSTARAEKRSKEVGIRKTIGSVRSQLVGQFFSESFLVVSSSFVFALILTQVLLPGFNLLAEKAIEIPWNSGGFWLACLSIVVITGLLAGGYPALYLSSFNPVQALKGTFRTGRVASLPRRVLVVFQFSISVILIIGTIVVYQQVQYAKNRPVGYNQQGLVMINKRTSDFNGKYEVLRTELIRTGVVTEVSESMGPMTEIYSGNDGWEWKGMDPNLDQSFGTLSVSHLHGRTVGWQFIQGTDFDPERIADSTGLVINEAALKVMGLEHPVGEPVRWTWWADKSRVMDYTIIGVVKDQVMASPYSPATPTMFYIKGLNGTPSWINIRLNPDVSASEALPHIEKVFKKVVPAAPFEYKFADEEYALKFAKEERVGNLATFFAVLAIFISCLGLLGLASYVAETRTKEIGVRKVLGATVAGIWRMMSRDFVWLVLIACLISAPLAYYLMGLWLENFVYRTPVSVWIFVATGAGAVGITLVTISYQAIRVATMNPVASLRSE